MLNANLHASTYDCIAAQSVNMHSRICAILTDKQTKKTQHEEVGLGVAGIGYKKIDISKMYLSTIKTC